LFHIATNFEAHLEFNATFSQKAPSR